MRLCVLKLVGLSTALTLSLVPPASAQTATANEIVKRVDIPYQSFTLDNGLRVLVHEDRKAPIVAVSIWYGVGSKNEPKGKTGFAHLFEHLMFNGSENAPDDFFSYTEGLGATDQNGTTWFDRTNYFQNVPTGALDRMLFLEADRMGHLLGGVTQANLDNQRSVVQNEKRQGDNQPYGLVEYEQLASLLPADHPYAHSTIGSMADLDSASLEDVKNWFRTNYAPNNAVLVLAGDINLATAKKLVQKNFGSFARGPVVAPVPTSVPTLPAPVAKVMKDKVAQTRIYRAWTVPGSLDKESVAINAAASILAGLSSSRLDNALVRQEKLVSSVSLESQNHTQLGFVDIHADVLPGGDPDTVAKRLDEIIADFIKNGPTADELERVKMSSASGTIRGLEEIGGFGGKATAIAQGALYANDPAFYKKQLQELARLTPSDVKAAAQKWLRRPALLLTVEPGERPAYEEASKPAVAAAKPAAPKVAAPKPLLAMPPVTKTPDLVFPKIETAQLSNGVEVRFARRSAVPTVNVSLQFDAGYSADQPGKAGLMSLMTQLVQEGTTKLNSTQIAEAKERLGAQIGVGSSRDRTFYMANALTTELTPTLDLLEDIVKNPAFDAGEIERLRGQRVAQIQSELTNPGALATRALRPAMFGKDHAYALPPTGTVADVQSITRDNLVKAYQSWIRPEKLQIFVTGDTTLAQIQPELERRFGQWKAASQAAEVKRVGAPLPQVGTIFFVDRPGSPQSIILAGQILETTIKGENEPLKIAADVLGGGSVGRLFMDLREDKGWSYGAYAFPQFDEHSVSLVAQAPVQADKTGPALQALRQNVQDLITTKSVTELEFRRGIDSRINSLPGSMETSAAVLGQMIDDAKAGHPTNYAATLPAKYRAMTINDVNGMARRLVDPAKFVWVVVGDGASVLPQLKSLGMPIEQVKFDATASK